MKKGKYTKIINKSIQDQKIKNKIIIDELKKIIIIVREMPNADDRLPLLSDLRVSLLDGGSVHRFTLIDKLEKRINKLEKSI
jgi:hypothetical protein